MSRTFNGYTPRVLFLLCFSVSSFIILLIALANVQIFQGEKLKYKAERQWLRRVMLRPVRGRIFSADGVTLADSRPVYNVVFYFSEMRQPGRYQNTVNFIADKIKETSIILEKEPYALNKEALIEYFVNSFNTRSAIRRNVFKEYWEITTLQNTYFKGFSEDDAWNKILNDLTFVRELENKATYSFRPFFRAVNYGRDIAIRLSNIKQPGAVWNGFSANQLWQKLRINEDEFRSKVLRNLSHQNLIKILGGENEILQNSIRRHPSISPYIAFYDLTDAQIGKISDQMPTISGLSFEVDYERIYPQNELGAHILGFTFKSYPQDADPEKRYDFVIKEPKGFMGLEANFNKDLAGKSGEAILSVDTGGFSRKIEEQKTAKAGSEIVLNISAKAQHAAEQAFLSKHKGKNGVVGVIDVKNGAILALASFPNFNPNNIKDNFRYYNTLGRKSPMFNHAISDAFEPGSIIKPLVGIAAFRSGLIKTDYIHNCDGWSYLYRKSTETYVQSKPRCTSIRRNGCGELDIVGALEHSCNPFFTSIGTTIGLENLQKIYQDIGFGTKTGIELPQEINGMIPDREAKKRRTNQDWSIFDTAMISIGHGDILITPLQALIYVSAIANGGKVFVPQLVNSIRDNSGKEIKSFSPIIKAHLNVSDSIMNLIKNGMENVVWGNGGSGKLARKAPIRLAGKTGTAALAKERFTWFICFGPIEKPKYACLVFLKDGEFGGTSAAPVAADFFRNFLNEDDLLPE